MAIVEAASTEALLEREQQLAHLRSSVASAARGQGRIVVVGGEAGVGKTSLARRFCDELPDGTAVSWGACDPLTTPRPLAPFLELAGDAGSAIEGVVDLWRRAPEDVDAATAAMLGSATVGPPGRLELLQDP